MSQRAESFFAVTGAEIVHGGSGACYIPSTDHIHMPCIDFFRNAESYYATLAHETTHWTRHSSRLNRDFGRKRFGDEGCAMEELVAELGSAFLSADLDLTPEVREHHAAYSAHGSRRSRTTSAPYLALRPMRSAQLIFCTSCRNP